MDSNNLKMSRADGTARLVPGGAQYEFSERSSVGLGDSVIAYIGDHEIGCAPIGYNESERCFFALIDLRHVPLVEFPAVIRAALAGSNTQLSDLAISHRDEILSSVPWSSVGGRISSINAEIVQCEILISSLPSYARSFSLMINGVESDVSISEPQRSDNSKEIYHIVNFKPADDIKDGDLIEVIDIRSKKRVLSLIMNWENMVSILTHKIHDQDQLIFKLNKQITTLEKRVNVMSNLSLEKIALERLDLYHSILNSKIDRMLRLIPATLENIPVEIADEHPIRSDDSIEISPSEVEGIGFYNLESNDVSEWRWIGPRATFAFKMLSTQPKMIIFHLGSLVTNANEQHITVSVNGTLAGASLNKISDNFDLEIPVLEYAWRKDNFAIVHLQFSEYKQSPGDERMLSAVLRSVQIRF